jgi:hypothetical protein
MSVLEIKIKPRPQPSADRPPVPVDGPTHRRCFDYALAVVAAGGKSSKLGTASPRTPKKKRGTTP